MGLAFRPRRSSMTRKVPRNQNSLASRREAQGDLKREPGEPRRSGGTGRWAPHTRSVGF